MNALHLLGTGLASFTFSDRSSAHDIVSLVGRYTLSSDPRVRSSAFEALLEMNRRGQKLDLSMYRDFCAALNDDYDGVRKAAIKLIYVLATTYPDEQVHWCLGISIVRTKFINKALRKAEYSDFCSFAKFETRNIPNIPNTLKIFH